MPNTCTPVHHFGVLGQFAGVPLRADTCGEVIFY